jgi:hypothetical protein
MKTPENELAELIGKAKAGILFQHRNQGDGDKK